MEVNVGDDWNFGHALANFFERNRRVVVGYSEPHDLATGGDHLFDLRDRRCHVSRVSLGHRLDDAGRAAADLDVLDLYCFRLSHYVLVKSSSFSLCSPKRQPKG